MRPRNECQRFVLVRGLTGLVIGQENLRQVILHGIDSQEHLDIGDIGEVIDDGVKAVWCDLSQSRAAET